MSKGKKVAFVVGCVDCRHHVPEAQLIKQLKRTLEVDDVYLFTLAGPDGQLVAEGVGYQSAVHDGCAIRDIKHADVFAVMGHYGCAGHNVDDAQHDLDTPAAAEKFAGAVERDCHALIFFASEQGWFNRLFKPTWLIKSLGVKNPKQEAVAAE